MKKNIMIVIFGFMVISLVPTSLAVVYDSSVVAVSLVNQDPDPASAGGIFEIRFSAENKGGEPTEDLMIEIDPEYPFLSVPGDNLTQKIGSLGAFQDGDDRKIVKFRVKVDRDATAGTYDLKVKYFEEGSGSKTQNTVSIAVDSSDNAEVIHIDKTFVVPGKEDSLEFSITNVGNAPLNDLTFRWVNADKVILPVGSDNTRHVNFIDVGDSAKLSYQVIADTNAAAGLYELTLYLSYDDPLTGDTKSVETLAGVYVGGGTDFDVALSDNTAGEVSFTIANVGSNPATSVAVIIPKQQGWGVTGSNSYIVGNLNKGDYTVASFTIQSAGGIFNQSTQGYNGTRTRPAMGDANKLQIQIAYTNTRGERVIVDKEVEMQASAMGTMGTVGGPASGTAFAGRMRTGTVVQQQNFFSKYMWYIMGMVIIVGALFFRAKYKRFKMAHPSGNMKTMMQRRK